MALKSTNLIKVHIYTILLTKSLTLQFVATLPLLVVVNIDSTSGSLLMLSESDSLVEVSASEFGASVSATTMSSSLSLDSIAESSDSESSSSDAEAALGSLSNTEAI